MLVLCYISARGFAPVQDINVPAAFVGVSQRVSEITFYFVTRLFNHLNYKTTDSRIKFNTTTKFEISEEELKRLYTIMALVQFPYDYAPEYKDYNLICRLRNSFHRFNEEISKVCDNDPNNLALSQIRNFVQRHYGYMKRVTAKLESQE